jgi:hypothetical protein
MAAIDSIHGLDQTPVSVKLVCSMRKTTEPAAASRRFLIALSFPLWGTPVVWSGMASDEESASEGERESNHAVSL